MVRYIENFGPKQGKSSNNGLKLLVLCFQLQQSRGGKRRQNKKEEESLLESQKERNARKLSSSFPRLDRIKQISFMYKKYHSI